MPLRNILRLSLVSSLVASVLAGVLPQAGGTSFPETVVRSRAIDLPTLAARGRGEGLRPAGVGLRATHAARTPPTVLCPGFWFTALGLVWEGDADVPVEAEVAAGRGPRSLGTATELDQEGGADPGSQEFDRGQQASTLLWTGESRCARIVLALPARARVADMRVVFVNSSGTQEGPGTGPEQPMPEAIAPPGTPVGLPTAEAWTNRPRLIYRGQWGANPALLNCDPSYAPAVKMAFVHHTAGTNGYARHRSDDIVRGIYAFHTQGRGWCDIAYNFLIDRFGRIFVGRAGGVAKPVIGAATQGFNTASTSVSVMGTFSSVRPSRAVVKALVRLLAWRLDVAKVAPRRKTTMTSGGGSNTRYPAGTVVKLPAVAPHRRTGYTDCPGDGLAHLLGTIRARVANRGLPKMYRPAVFPAVLGEGVRSVRVRAVGSGELRWVVELRGPGGELVGRRRQRATRLSLAWNGSGTTGFPARPGTATFAIRATDAVGRSARPAKLPLEVVVPPP